MKMNKRSKYVLRRFILVIVVLLLGFLALAIGLMIGYGILGKGQDPWAILAPANGKNSSQNLQENRLGDQSFSKEIRRKMDKNGNGTVSRRNIPSQNLYRDEKTISEFSCQCHHFHYNGRCCFIDTAKIRTKVESTKYISYFFHTNRERLCHFLSS